MKLVLSLLFTFVTVQSFAATEEEAFGSYSALNTLPTKKQFLNEIERERLFRNVRFHKVAAVEKLGKYDPSGMIGFCFGRAMTSHLLARKMGLDSASIKKLFIIGDLRSGPNPEWRFHVTTLVKGEDGKWWAVDPIMLPPIAAGGSIPVQDWMKAVQNTWDKKKKAHFYLADNSTIIPDLRDVPEPHLEKGDKVIEVAFDPNNKEGMTPGTFEGFTYFEVASKAQHDLFTDAFEKTVENRFQYLGIHINGQLFDYKNYFVDLFHEIQKEISEPNPFGEVEPFSMKGLVNPTPTSLYSPRVEAWFR